VPPPARSALTLVGVSAVSVQCGAALATRLFHRVGPTGAVTLRLVLAAALLAALLRPRRPLGGCRDLAVAAAFGATLAAMNILFYEAIARIPLGVAVTVEFVGPLVVSLVGSRRGHHLLWAGLAAAGVALLATGSGHGVDLVGVVLALGAGACWAGYIALSKETGRRFPGTTGLAVAMVVSALLVLPVGLATATGSLVSPAVLGLGAVVAILSSVIPYSFELAALRRVSTRSFGVLLSLDPAVAALAGLVILGQHLSGRELLALAFVVAANVGNALVGESDTAGIVPD
jgi:inner membrane transporter RhtA